MYTASGGYYYQGSSSIQKKPKLRRLGRIRMIQVMFLTLLILSFVFGAVMNAYATNEAPLHTTEELLILPELESPPLHQTHIVDAGQSLWLIAKQYVPVSMEIRDYVDELVEINQLDTNVLFVGQRLLLPTI